MRSFFDEILKYNWEEECGSIYAKRAVHVEEALGKEKRTLEDFKALVSPAASGFLEPMAKLSKKLTQKRFGKTIQLYLPLYLSNECTNFCVYCGFNHNNKINRLTLNEEMVLKEVEAIKDMGYEHLLLVTGEHSRKCGVDFLARMIELVKPWFSQISVEVAPMDQDEYERLLKSGLNTVYIYQETYHSANYGLYHPKGKKANFRYRLETPDRLGKAGVHRVGLGCLLGLEDWRTDSYFTALHLNYLERNYWKTKYSISFPRLRPHAGSFQPNFIVTDRDLAQLIFAYRIFDEEVEISLSTREKPSFRDNMLKLGVTSMSAGSKTEPGGYALNTRALEQFTVSDNRTAAEIEAKIKQFGYEAVWKDWDACLQE